MENRREVTLTGFSSNAIDDVLRSNNNEPNTLNGNPSSAHAITKDAKIVNLEGESLLLNLINQAVYLSERILYLVRIFKK